MRILFFTSLERWHGRRWVSALAESYEVHVATFAPPSRPLPENVFVHALQQPKASQSQQKQKSENGNDGFLTFKIGMRFAKRFAQIIDQVRPNVVHAHQTVPFGWYASRALQQAKHKAPFVVSAWGSDVEYFPYQSLWYRYINKKALQKADLVTATGTYLQEQTAKWTKKPVELTPFGVDTSDFFPVAKIDTRPFTFGIAKALKPVYGIDVAFKAFAILAKSNTDARLEVAGAGPEEDRLRQLAKKLQIDARVKWLGHVEINDIAKVMRRWNTLLMPSRRESFGVSALEAQASGIPVIAHNIGGIPEVITNQTAILVSRLEPQAFASAMQRAMTDKSLQEAARSKGPQFVANTYEWRDTVKIMEQVYAKALAK